MVSKHPWEELRTGQQNDLFQAACRDLSQGLSWYGNKLTHDEWRWLICANVLGVKVVPAINTGDGRGGVVTLGGSSRRLTKEQGTQAITLAFAIGDAPWEYDSTQDQAVIWSPVVCLARWITEDEPYEVRQVYQAPNKDGSPENRCRERGAVHGVSGKG